MSGLMTPERARELLEARLDELGALRNAHARDPNFKQWRQATLTVIQRIWPGDVLRAERFRRVPFSPPSTKMSLKATRSFFEKGCAEATSLVRNMIRELGGVAGRPQRMEPSAAPGPGEVEDDFPIVDLPGKSGRATQPNSDDDDDGIAIPPAPTPAPEPRAKPDAGRVSMKSTSTTNDARPPLREMLGFSSRPMDEDEEVDEPEALPDLERTPIFEGFDAKAEENEWEVDESGADADFVSHDAGGEWDAPQEFQLPARVRQSRIADEADAIIETDPENFPPAEAEASEAGAEASEAEDEPDTGAEMEEFMRTSPVLKASARPVKKRDSNVPATPSPAAASLVALASEVAHLGVPEGQRAGMRATLLELARRVDERSIDWDSLRDSFHAVLDFPPLARRVIPLLIPYLDAAA
jgi:hypothetical protein